MIDSSLWSSIPWPRYKVIETNRKPYTYQIYELWQTNPDGTAEYSLYPKGNDYLFFKTKLAAQKHITKLETTKEISNED